MFQRGEIESDFLFDGILREMKIDLSRPLSMDVRRIINKYARRIPLDSLILKEGDFEKVDWLMNQVSQKIDFFEIERIYLHSRDGPQNSQMHALIDGKGPTIT